MSVGRTSNCLSYNNWLIADPTRMSKMYLYSEHLLHEHHQFQVRPLPTIAWKHKLYSWHHLALNFHSMDPDAPFPFTAGWLLLTHNQMSLRYCSTVQMKKHLILRKLHPTAIGRVRTSQLQTTKIYLFSSYLWSLPLRTELPFSIAEGWLLCIIAIAVAFEA